MALFDQVIERTEGWLIDLDVERDATARQIGLGHSWLIPHLERLEVERADVIALLEKLRELYKRRHPALLFDKRPMPLYDGRERFPVLKVGARQPWRQRASK